MDTKIPIIRALWGDTQRTLREIIPLPLFKNEIVCVWGNKNESFLKSKGYSTINMSNLSTDPQYSSPKLQYYHKLEAVKKAGEVYGEFIFLDWDCYLLRPLDNYFYNSLQKGNDIQVPTYAYTDIKYLGIQKQILNKTTKRYQNKITESFRQHLLQQEAQLRKYSWKHEDLLVSPNFCFFYSRNPNIGEELIEISKLNKVEICIEEHAMYLWANCSMDEFIKKYEPKVLYGTATETRTLGQYYDKENDPIIKINNYISKLVDKTIYFNHI